jgi:O-succinylbenzoic acid--CoA ligase
MANLVALEMPIGVSLVDFIKTCANNHEAFTILDPNWSGQRRSELLDVLRPTHLIDTSGHRQTLEGEPVDDGDGAVVLTSGSAGRPKAAVLTWEALQASATLTTQTLAREGEQRWLAAIPPTHIGGLAVLLRSVLADASLLFDATVESGPALGATHVSVVRTQLVRYDTSNYQCVLLGGGPPPPNVPDNVTTTWGMTETGSGVVYDQTPLPGVELAVVEGELLIKSPTLLRTYRDRPRPEVSTNGSDGWFPTGDGATLLDGKLRIQGRLAYVITSGGEKIWPEDLESLFRDIEGVDDLAVVGREDAEWGQRVTVVAVSTRSEGELLELCRALARERFGPWAQPKAIELVSTIPRTSNGKIARGLL